MSYLKALFAHGNVADWVAFAGSARAGRIDEDDGVVGQKNASWQDGGRSDYYIEAQRIGYQVVLGGLAGSDSALVSRGLKAIEWGHEPSVLGPNSDWGFNREWDDILAHAAHPRTMFAAASVETVLAILEHDTLRPRLHERAAALVDGIEQSAAAYIASGDAERFRTKCVNSSQIVFQATWMQGAYELTGEKDFKIEAKRTLKAMMDLQLDGGAFGEKTGFDTSYTLQTLRELVAYRDMLPGKGGGTWHTKVSSFITRGADWLLGRVQPDGSIDTTGNSRTAATDAPVKGDFAKGWAIDKSAISLAQYASAFGRWDELSATITAVQNRGQAYDHIGDVVPPAV